ncbi:restriction endonuclease subunit S [Sharpea porci]|nr:restriction endonuclease subunit S [Sharpea porci]MDY5278761.1 restriction endonuclease subunit S [Sharpea porci]
MKSNKQVITLGDVASYINGYAFKPDDRGTEGLPIIRIQDLTGSANDLGYYNGEYPKKIEINNGDILISWSGSLGIYTWNNGKALLNQHIFKVEFDKVNIEKSYFVYAVQKKLEEMKTKTHGATMKHIVKKDFESTLIPFPSLKEQKEIATKLDNIRATIAQRKEELKLLDDLIKARFVEMFGDPVRNEKEWQTKALEDVCKSIVDCPHSTPSYTSEDSGFMCIRTSIVKKNRIMWEDIEYIPEEEYIQRIQRKKPEKGDVVYTREGAILGIAAVIDRDCNVALGQRSMLLSPDRAFCTPEFISVAMNFDSFLDNALKGMSGSASPHINVGDIKAFKMILPPIKQQEVFSDFVTQVDKSRFVVQKALDEAQLLFDSLMQEYFG